MEIAGLGPETRESFADIAHRLGLEADDLVARMIEHVVIIDRRLRESGFEGIGALPDRVGCDEAVSRAADVASGDVRETEFMWPSDRPLPWTDAQCAAACRGYAVRWPLSREEFFLLRGAWELVGGYAVLRQP